MSGRRLTIVLAALTLFVLVLSLPGSLREAYERGGLYVFSWTFLEDIPRRLTGPGWFRFLLQPVFAAALGVRAGRSDARAGKSPYLWALAVGDGSRGELVRGAVGKIANLLLMGVLLDSLFQWLILGAAYPGAALVAGPVLIALPYAVARSPANRFSRY